MTLTWADVLFPPILVTIFNIDGSRVHADLLQNKLTMDIITQNLYLKFIMIVYDITLNSKYELTLIQK